MACWIRWQIPPGCRRLPVSTDAAAVKLAAGTLVVGEHQQRLAGAQTDNQTRRKGDAAIDARCRKMPGVVYEARQSLPVDANRRRGELSPLANCRRAHWS